jgi:hypothetical protein
VRALAGVAGERGRALELGPGLLAPSEPGKQVAPDGRHQVIAPQCGVVRDRVDDGKAGRGPVRHPDRDRTVELDHR